MSTREQILAAAEKLYARQGYDSVTVDQIAREAGLTKGAVYYFFRNKAEVFCLVVDQGLAYIEEQCRAILETPGSSRDIAQAVITFFTNIAYDNASLFLILFGSRSADSGVQAMFDERSRRLMDCICRMTEMGMRYELLQPLDPQILARMFVGIIYGLLALPDPPDRAGAMQTIGRLLFGGLFAESAEGGAQ